MNQKPSRVDISKMGSKYTKAEREANEKFLEFCRNFRYDESTEADMNEFLEREHIDINYSKRRPIRLSEEVNKCYYSPLTASIVYCRKSSSIECVKLLLKKGADPNKCGNNWKRSPLRIALNMSNFDNAYECAELLLSHGANPNRNIIVHYLSYTSRVSECYFNVVRTRTPKQIRSTVRLLYKYGARINYNKPLNWLVKIQISFRDIDKHRFKTRYTMPLKTIIELTNPKKHHLKKMFLYLFNQDYRLNYGHIVTKMYLIYKAGVRLSSSQKREAIRLFKSKGLMKSKKRKPRSRKEPNEEKIKIILDSSDSSFSSSSSSSSSEY